MDLLPNWVSAVNPTRAITAGTKGDHASTTITNESSPLQELCRKLQFSGIIQRCQTHPYEALPLLSSCTPEYPQCHGNVLSTLIHSLGERHQLPVGWYEAVQALIAAAPEILLTKGPIGPPLKDSLSSRPYCHPKLVQCLLLPDLIDSQERYGVNVMELVLEKTLDQEGDWLQVLSKTLEIRLKQQVSKIRGGYSSSPLRIYFRVLGANERPLADTVLRMLLRDNGPKLKSDYRFNGDTVLHYALKCTGGRHFRLIDTLVAHDSEVALVANDENELPLHFACRFCFQADATTPTAIRQQNQTFELILRVTMMEHHRQGGSSSDVIWVRSKNGATPLRSLYDSWTVPNYQELEPTSTGYFSERTSFDSINFLRTITPQLLKLACFGQEESRPVVTGLFNAAFVRGFQLLLRAGTSPTLELNHLFDDEEPLFLHRIAQSAFHILPVKAIPFDFLALAIAYGSIEQARAPDEHGMLPLHYAVQQHGLLKGDENSDGAAEWKNWVEQLLAVYPAAESTTDHLGRVPLHYLLEHVPVAPRPNSESFRRAINDLALLLACEGTSCPGIYDPVTRMYPFLMGAINPWLSLSTVYDCLRQYPSGIEESRGRLFNKTVTSKDSLVSLDDCCGQV